MHDQPGGRSRRRGSASVSSSQATPLDDSPAMNSVNALPLSPLSTSGSELPTGGYMFSTDNEGNPVFTQIGKPSSNGTSLSKLGRRKENEEGGWGDQEPEDGEGAWGVQDEDDDGWGDSSVPQFDSEPGWTRKVPLSALSLRDD